MHEIYAGDSPPPDGETTDLTEPEEVPTTVSDTWPALTWMRPMAAFTTLSKAAHYLGVTLPDAPETDFNAIIPPTGPDFWGAIVLTYEAGVLVSVEKRELQ